LLQSNGPNNRWNEINAVLRNKNIATLAVQETHLTRDRCSQIETQFGKRLTLFASPNPIHPTQCSGVAIVLNKEKINTDTAVRNHLQTSHPHYPRLATECAPNVPMCICTKHHQICQHWTDIELYFRRNPATPHPQVLLGDFNMVENSVDRTPCRTDPLDCQEALTGLLSYLNVGDTFQCTYPTEHQFTFAHSSQSTHSQIDHMYLSPGLLRASSGWTLLGSGLDTTDHKIPSIQITNQDPV
jgi:exonuclease III